MKLCAVRVSERSTGYRAVPRSAAQCRSGVRGTPRRQRSVDPKLKQTFLRTTYVWTHSDKTPCPLFKTSQIHDARHRRFWKENSFQAENRPFFRFKILFLQSSSSKKKIFDLRGSNHVEPRFMNLSFGENSDMVRTPTRTEPRNRLSRISSRPGGWAMAFKVVWELGTRCLACSRKRETLSRSLA